MQSNKAQNPPNHNHTHQKQANQKIYNTTVIMTRMEGKNKHIVERETKKQMQQKKNPIQKKKQIHNKNLRE